MINENFDRTREYRLWLTHRKPISWASVKEFYYKGQGGGAREGKKRIFKSDLRRRLLTPSEEREMPIFTANKLLLCCDVGRRHRIHLPIPQIPFFLPKCQMQEVGKNDRGRRGRGIRGKLPLFLSASIADLRVLIFRRSFFSGYLLMTSSNLFLEA